MLVNTPCPRRHERVSAKAPGLLGFACTLVLFATAVCAGCATQVKGRCSPQLGDPAETVYLVSHGWHAGIVFEREPVRGWPLADDFPDAEYLEVGWGDKDFYQTRDPHWALAAKAVLLPTASVLHVAGFSGAVADTFPASEILSIRLSPEAFEQLSRHVADSIAMDTTGQVEALGPGLYGHSRFYLSRDTYHAFNTCNVWTARALRAAGCPVAPAGAITVDDLLRQVRPFATPVQRRRHSRSAVRVSVRVSSRRPHPANGAHYRG